MKLSTFSKSQTKALAELLRRAFTTSEGEQEGEMVKSLVEELVATTPQEQLIGFVAKNHQDKLLGAIFFSQFQLPDGPESYLLSPVGVSTEAQSSGIGQALITYGLEYLKIKGVELVVTYGDPNYYKRVGFQQVSEDLIPAPYNLSQPHGWMAQSLNEQTMPTLTGPSRCVEAFSKAEYW
jgi:predicted N-acetyltransferase YhbS